MQLKNQRGVQLEEVWSAADSLIEQGEKPTIEKVRLKMGRGSPNTVGPMLDAWFGNLGERLNKNKMPVHPLMPVAVQEAALSLWEAANNAAQHQAQARFQEEYEQLNIQKSELEVQKVDFFQRQQLHQEKLQLLELQLQQSQDLHLQQKERIQGLEASFLAEQEKTHRLSLQLEKRQEQANLDRQQYDQHLSQLHLERQQLSEKFAQNEKRWLLELDRTRQDLLQAKKKLQESEKMFEQEKNALRLEINLCNESLEVSNAKEQQSRNNILAALRINEDQKIELSKLKKLNSELRQKLEAPKNKNLKVSSQGSPEKTLVSLPRFRPLANNRSNLKGFKRSKIF